MLQQDEIDHYVNATADPAEVDLLIGDPIKAKRKLGWEAKTSFKQLVHLMVEADMAAIRRGDHS